jgi:hypothetical protein
MPDASLLQEPTRTLFDGPTTENLRDRVNIPHAESMNALEARTFPF